MPPNSDLSLLIAHAGKISVNGVQGFSQVPT